MEFTHFDGDGNARMVDVGEKEETRREAVARGSIFLSPECFAKVSEGSMSLTKLTVDFEMREDTHEIQAVCTACTVGKTGVEMEALTGVSVALLTIYDMCKAVDKSMEIGEICLEKKTGGKSGVYERRRD